MHIKMFSQGTIMVVETNEPTAYLLDFLLSREGYKVISVTNEELLHDSLQLSPPHLIILNSRLSYQQGNQLIGLCRAQPGWREIPILMLSSDYVSDEISSALSAGANDYIVQPFQHAELIGQVGRHLHSLQ
ncbi:MAG: response regulator [Gammaproteobacteria bacterium]